MTVLRSTLAVSLAGLTAACATAPRDQGPRPVTPERGPGASIRVGYTGGLLNRTLTAYFRVDQNAYVLVGHLGGDGVIRVLYPQTAGAGWINAKKSYSTGEFDAPHDGLPSLMSHAVSPYRHYGALNDSYDGRGHGFVFIIASGRPLAYHQLLDDAGNWSEWEISDYQTSTDPRYAVRDFADAVSRGPYTLRFAGSFTTAQYDAIATRYWDCSLLSSFGSYAHAFMATAVNPWYSPLTGWTYFTPAGYCSGYNNVHRYAYYTGGTVGIPVGRVIPVPPIEPGEPAPTLNRPGRRAFGPPPPTPRSTITRVAAGSSGSGESSRPRPTYGSRPGRRGDSDWHDRAHGSQTGSRHHDPPPTRGRSGASGSESGSAGAPRSTTGSESPRPSSAPSVGESGRGTTSPRESRRP